MLFFLVQKTAIYLVLRCFLFAIKWEYLRGRIDEEIKNILHPEDIIKPKGFLRDFLSLIAEAK